MYKYLFDSLVQQVTATLTPRETLAMIRMVSVRVAKITTVRSTKVSLCLQVLLQRWGDRGARRAFSSLGEQGGCQLYTCILALLVHEPLV